MELPEYFKTWVEFYENCKRLPDFDYLQTVVVIDEKRGVNIKNTIYPEDIPDGGVHYPVREIMANALEEILAERFNKDEVIYLFQFLDKEVGRHISENPLADEFRKAKRILLTTAIK